MTRSILPLLAAAVLLGPATALAQSNLETRLREALRTATTQLQTLQDEQAQWQAKEAQYKKQVEELQKELAASRKAVKSGSSAASVKKEYEEKLSAAGLSLAQCQKEAQEAQQQARAREDERVQIAGRLDGLSTRAAACEARNGRLYRVGKDILDWLDGLGFGAALMAREPFLGLKRVELENAAQDFRDKLSDQRIAPASDEAGALKAASAR